MRSDGIVVSTEKQISGETRSRGEVIAFPSTRLTLGLFVPLETFVPQSPELLKWHLALAGQLDDSDFAVLWARDRLMSEIEGRERAEMLDPWVYLGALAARTKSITIGAASIIITLRHPISVAKAAASVDRLSGGRFLLGVASGTRQDEYPAFGVDSRLKGSRFQEAVTVIRQLWASSYPTLNSVFGNIEGLDLQPKPLGETIPLLVTGWSGGQTLPWIANNSDGWFQFLLSHPERDELVREWRHQCLELTGRLKPLLQGVFLNLDRNPGALSSQIEQGFSGGRRALVDWLFEAQERGICHIAFNLKRSERPVAEVVYELAEHVTPLFKRGEDPLVSPIS